MTPTVLVAGSKVSITRVGFGCARIFGGIEKRASSKLIEAALEVGIRHFDTAPSYGDGESEAVLGTVLAGIDDVTVTTKIGIPRPALSVRPYSGAVLYRRFARPFISRFPRTKAKLLRIIGRSSIGVGKAAASLPFRRLNREEVLRELKSKV